MKHPNIPFSRPGFTVLELLVASLLLGMLVTMLTMIFNQSSIAWRTGISSVSKLETQRERIGGYHDIADDALPGVGDDGVNGIENTARSVNYRTVSIFKNWDGNSRPQNQSRDVSGRLIDTINWGNLTPISASAAMRGQTINLPNAGYATARDSIVVGVMSYGPDRQKDTDDDINTYPEEVE